MAHQRSPNYPNISLPDAIARARKAYDLDRDAPLDREVAAKHIGYSGRSGASDKGIGSIAQYGLFETATSFLIREKFLPNAIERLYSSYVATCQFLKQEGATDFSVPSTETVEESPVSESVASHSNEVEQPVQSSPARQRPRSPYSNMEAHGMQRMLTQGMLSKGSTFEIIVTGKIGPKEIDTLIRKLEIDKAILADDDENYGEAEE